MVISHFNTFFVLEWQEAVIDLVFVTTILSIAYYFKCFYDWRNPNLKSLINSLILYGIIAIIYIPFAIIVTKISYMLIINYGLLIAIAVSQIYDYHKHKNLNQK